jgi:hypothetical protein
VELYPTPLIHRHSMVVWQRNNLPTSEVDNDVYFRFAVRLHGLVYSDLELLLKFSTLRFRIFGRKISTFQSLCLHRIINLCLQLSQ